MIALLAKSARMLQGIKDEYDKVRRIRKLIMNVGMTYVMAFEKARMYTTNIAMPCKV